MAKGAPEIQLPMKTRAVGFLARLLDVPPSGHGLAGRRASGVVIVERCDWLERERLQPKFRDAEFDFGRRARWSSARHLAEVVLERHFNPPHAPREREKRRIERILGDEFTRQIVRVLPDKWHLDDTALRAWLWHFEARRRHYAGFDVRGYTF